jgi:hypothetical protein
MRRRSRQCCKLFWGRWSGCRPASSTLRLPLAEPAVEWHQDGAFYPHTNDDLLAIGVILEDVDTSSEPLMVIPGTHKGPVLSHFHGSVFAGAIDPADPLFARDGIVTSPAGRDR